MKTTLLHEVNEPDGAEKTFSKVIELINSAKSSIIIHMYVWRSDNIGNAIGDALCDAADRGIKIQIKKEWSAILLTRALKSAGVFPLLASGPQKTRARPRRT